MTPFPGVVSWPLSRLITLDHSHQGMGNVLSLLEQILTLDTDLSSLHAVLLPKLLPVDLQNALVKELISQQKKCDIRLGPGS